MAAIRFCGSPFLKAQGCEAWVSWYWNQYTWSLVGVSRSENQPPTHVVPKGSALASLAPVQSDQGEKGDIWGNWRENSSERRTAKHLTSLPGCPAFLQADFHCQKGWRKGFARGHVAVAHWILPSAFSMALVEKTLPEAKSCRRDKTMTCLSLAIWTPTMCWFPRALSSSNSEVLPMPPKRQEVPV